MNLDRGEKAFIGVFGLVILLHIAFWGAVIYVAWHFVSKLW